MRRQPEQVLLEVRAWVDEQRRLPLSCDALVLTLAEPYQLLGSSSRMAQELQCDLRWFD